jgi:hypothetical protein
VSFWFRAGPFGVSSRGRASVRVGPVGVSGGGRRSSSSGDGGLVFWVFVAFLVVVAGVVWAAEKVWQYAIMDGVVRAAEYVWPPLDNYGPPVAAFTVLGAAVIFTLAGVVYALRDRPQNRPSLSASATRPQVEPRANRLATVGKQRGLVFGIVLCLCTFGAYSLYWTYRTANEIRRQTGAGIGGVSAVAVLILFWPAIGFVIASEVGKMYSKAGRTASVSGRTGFWLFPGFYLLLIGPVVWWVKVQGALNRYWQEQTPTRSLGGVTLAAER